LPLLDLPSFPTRRSSDLRRRLVSCMRVILNPAARHGAGRRLRPLIERELESRRLAFDIVITEGPGHAVELAREAADAGIERVIADRKSTRLNSSHVKISY